MIQAPPAPLPEVIVTAARLPPAAGEAAFSVVRLDDRSLGRALRLDEALASVPAVSLFRRTSSLSANPTTQGISLRAIAPSGAGRTLVTLDGVPLNDPFGGWVIWSRVAPESLSGLDIVRGAGAGPYGAGALTGVIALGERDGIGGVVDAGLSSRGGRRLAGSATAELGPVRLVASGLFDTSDGYVPVRGNQAGAADTALDLDARSAALRADVPLGDAALSLRASTWEEDRGSGLAGARANASGSGLSATLTRQPDADRPGWRLQAWQTRSNLTNGSVAVAADRSSTTPANDQFHTPATGRGLNAALRRTGMAVAGGRLEWELGFDARSAEGETNERSRNLGAGFTRSRSAGGETSVAGAYGEGAWSGGDWLLAGGLRLDHWSNRNGRRLEHDLTTGLPTLDETDPDRSGTVTSARFAARRDLGRDFAVRAATYSSFRPATTLNLRAEWALIPDTILWLAAENLFDFDVEVSETATGVVGFGPPRSLGLGLRRTW